MDVPQEDGTSQWWSVIFQDRNKLGRVPTLQPVYWEQDEDGLWWPMMGVEGQNGRPGRGHHGKTQHRRGYGAHSPRRLGRV